MCKAISHGFVIQGVCRVGRKKLPDNKRRWNQERQERMIELQPKNCIEDSRTHAKPSKDNQAV